MLLAELQLVYHGHCWNIDALIKAKSTHAVPVVSNTTALAGIVGAGLEHTICIVSLAVRQFLIAVIVNVVVHACNTLNTVLEPYTQAQETASIISGSSLIRNHVPLLS